MSKKNRILKEKKMSVSSQNNVELRQEEDQDESIERSKYVYELVNKWIENADNKVNTSCAIFIGVFGIISFLTEQYIKVLNRDFYFLFVRVTSCEPFFARVTPKIAP